MYAFSTPLSVTKSPSWNRTVCWRSPRSVRTGPLRSAHAITAQVATETSQFDQLAKITTIVEDTGEINYIKEHRPFAATTNPTLVGKAADCAEYEDIVTDAIEYGRKYGGQTQDEKVALARNCLFTRFGARILEFIPGDVSTEVDARLSFNVDAQVSTALDLIRMYEEVGVSKDRVLIKLATTWEGVQACRILEQQGVKTNMTLLFGMAQAIAAADAGAYLISPFVGRILDWYKKREGKDSYPAQQDPGVISVRKIYDYYKCAGIDTIVMGASFRNVDEILQLAGCDRLTIAPKFISELKKSNEPIDRLLNPPSPHSCEVIEKIQLTEAEFRWQLNEDQMATDKLAEGIRGFAADLEKLDEKLRKMI